MNTPWAGLRPACPPRAWWAWWAWLSALALTVLGTAPPALAGASFGLCEQAQATDLAQQDARLRLAALLRQQLEASGAEVVLVARSGVDLGRFGLRYSHAGLALRASPNTAWSVRQLYYACQEGRPRLFDQGLAGFVLAADAQPVVHVSLLLMPAADAAAVAAAALHKPTALALLAPRYSANAHAFNTLYQNCNQWVAELLAAAWGDLGPEPDRAAAQQWLQVQGYVPHRFQVHPLLALLARAVPLLHHDDHPADAATAGVFDVSLPDTLRAFVQQRLPASRHIELCQTPHHIVLRRDGPPLGDACEPAAGDETLPL